MLTFFIVRNTTQWITFSHLLLIQETKIKTKLTENQVKEKKEFWLEKFLMISTLCGELLWLCECAMHYARNSV